MKISITIAAAALLATGASADLMKPAAPTMVRGTITAVAGPVLSVTTKDGGKATVVLAPDARIAGVSTVALDAIKPNSFIGTTAVEGPGGVLRATEVHVFPEAMRGAGEGHYPWDTGAKSLTAKSSMTNGNVARMANGGVASMTNGNVGAVGNAKGVSGRTLTVDYKGGQQKIFVPANVPVVMLEAGTVALLVPGSRIFTRATKGSDGRLMTNSVAVGIKGTVPPM